MWETFLTIEIEAAYKNVCGSVGMFVRVCGEFLSELPDEIVPKLFNSPADSETKNAGNEALEALTEAVSFVRVMKKLPEVLSSQSPIKRKEALL